MKIKSEEETFLLLFLFHLVFFRFGGEWKEIGNESELVWNDVDDDE